MLTSTQIFDQYCLEARRDLLEVAALLDRYDAALEREGVRGGNHAMREILDRALTHLADSETTSGERTTPLLELFAEI